MNLFSLIMKWCQSCWQEMAAAHSPRRQTAHPGTMHARVNYRERGRARAASDDVLAKNSEMLGWYQAMNPPGIHQGLSILLAVLLSSVMVPELSAQETPKQDAAPQIQPDAAQPQADVAEVRSEKPREVGPLARYVTITNPVDDLVYTRVRNALVKLQHEAEQEDRSAVLVLEIERGLSKFGQVRDLTKELTSERYSRVTTVAWIPEDSEERPLDGFVAMVALACREIVMHPDAEFGDIGVGQAIDDDEARAVVNMVEKRYNQKVNGALAAGFCDPQEIVLKVKIESRDGLSETRVVTNEEFRRLQETNVAIPDVINIKEQGQTFRLSGSRARALDVLVTQTAQDRVDLADLYGFDRRYLREDITEGEAPRPRLIRLEGVVDPFMQEFAEREIRRALASGANLIIFEIESPGGYLLESEQIAETISQIDSKKCRTVAFVPDHAYSGAAIISMGCDEIYLAPEAKIGDAGPIEMRAGEQFERADEKVLSPLRQTLRLLAERKNRPPALLEAMADKDLLVYQVTHRETGRAWYLSEEELEASSGEWIKGPIVPESREGNLLTLTGDRAHELKLAGEPTRDLSELKTRLGIPQDHVIPAAKQTWVDTMVVILKSPGATFLLFMVGLICIYLEVYTQVGFFGVMSALCFAVFFWSRFLGGTAGWLEVTLFIFGLALVALEIFVIPGFGVFGITGGLAIIFSLILASQTFVIPTTGEELEQLSWTMGTLSGSIVAMLFVTLFMGRFMVYIPGLRDMVLAAQEEEAGPKLDPHLTGANPTALIEHDIALVGKTGVAFSTLRPAGKAEIDGRVLDVVSAGDFIDRGTPVEVVEVNGNLVTVQAVTQA